MCPQWETFGQKLRKVPAEQGGIQGTTQQNASKKLIFEIEKKTLRARPPGPRQGGRDAPTESTPAALSRS